MTSDDRPIVVVCRAADQAGPLVTELEARGFAVLALPLLEVVGPLDPTPLERAVADLADFDWVAFTSTNAVEAVLGTLRGGPWPGATQVAVVGRATAAAVRAAGWPVDLAPARATAGDLAALLVAHHASGRLLAPLAELAGDDLSSTLEAAGWEVARVEAYRTVTPVQDAAALDAASAAAVVCITAGSIAERFVEAMGERRLPPAVCIGPSSEATARRVGLDVAAVADPHDRVGLVAAVARTLT